MGHLKLNKGDLVTVFNFKLSGEKFDEGKAKLVEFNCSSGGRENWQVEFVKEPGELYSRWIDWPEYDDTEDDLGQDGFPLGDEFEYIGPRVKAVAFRIGYDWHVQVEGYPENHFDSYLSNPGPIPNDKLDLWIKCRPWFEVRKEE